MNGIVLNREASRRRGVGFYSGVQFDAPTVAGHDATPIADITSVNNDIVDTVVNVNTVNGGALQNESLDDHVRGVHHDTVVGTSVNVNHPRCPRGWFIENITATCSTLIDGQRRISGLNRNGLRDG